MTRCAIGVDIGTTSTKAVVFASGGDGARRGAALGQHAVEYPLETPVVGAAEQDPERIFDAVIEAIGGAVAAAGIDGGIACIAFSAAMHSVIAVDDDDRPLTQSITWADNRAAPWSRRIEAEHDGRVIYRRTGTPIHPMSPLVKLLWLRETRPDVWRAARRFVGIKEFVLRRLCGVWVVDHSIASATGLFDLASRDWDAGALALCGLDAGRLSTLVPTTHRIALDATMASRLGVPPDTPVIVGANDGVLSNVGVGAVARGSVALTIGTSGAIRTVVDAPRTDPDGRTFCYALTERHWVVGGPVSNGGIVLRWVRDEFAAAETETAKRLGVDPYEVLTQIAERVPAGSAGLLFHPYLTGERAPLWNADLRGSFFGLAIHHRKEHMIRAVLEGVLMNLLTILPAVEAVIGRTRVLKATGGFARSAMWRQMLADVFDRDVVVPESIESSCFGAAMLGLLAIGELASLEAVDDLIGATFEHRPEPAAAATYARLAPIYTELPRLLQAQYAAIAAFQRDG